MEIQWTLEDFLRCSGSTKLAGEMVAAGPFKDLDDAIRSARDIWFNKIDVKGWLEAFTAHPEIGDTSKPISKEEQSTAMATAGDGTMQELFVWNARYKEKFGFVFLICASGKESPVILSELKRRFPNRPIVELGIAAEEEIKIFELRLRKLFDSKLGTSSPLVAMVPSKNIEGVIGGHIMPVADDSPGKPHETAAAHLQQRSRPPITTHVLDVARGLPASGVVVHLEIWKGTENSPPLFAERDSRSWVLLGSSITNSDGRSGPLMAITDYIDPGFYRVTFDSGRYNPAGFFPYVSIVFEVREQQKSEHFHVPLLLSPFSFSTYRGS
ncbi:Uric acid degradation bifunctional protein TTL [Apostasia shenzhenica]|uniref:Uric acid degradation bifunctional protein TTL n=1 Tax=Apostasia shenzhenica TaxID=1088818 RepID=A0A2I0AX04_9ASPA|nr:Uric acid degradation bifunctional protein TTL [Apostasia shenzhenica]